MASQPVTIEAAFSLIEKGNSAKDDKSWWEASDAFCQAFGILAKLQHNSDASANGDDACKIVELYQKQAAAYKGKAQAALLCALEAYMSENEQETLSDEEAASRIDLFAHLFSKPGALATLSAPEPTSKEQQSSLEKRLSELNLTLPSGFKTSDERMRDINRGLNRLGLSSVASQARADSNMGQKISPTLLEDQQVDQIIAQARDEAIFTASQEPLDPGSSPLQDSSPNKVHTDSVDALIDATAAAMSDEIANVNSDADSSEADCGSLNTQTLSLIQDRVTDAQATLSEVLAVLQEDCDYRDAGDGILTDPPSLRQSLKDARRKLREALGSLDREKSEKKTEEEAGVLEAADETPMTAEAPSVEKSVPRPDEQKEETVPSIDDETAAAEIEDKAGVSKGQQHEENGVCPDVAASDVSAAENQPQVDEQPPCTGSPTETEAEIEVPPLDADIQEVDDGKEDETAPDDTPKG